MRFKTSNGSGWSKCGRYRCVVVYFDRHVLYNDPLGCNESERHFYPTLADYIACEG